MAENAVPVINILAITVDIVAAYVVVVVLDIVGCAVRKLIVLAGPVTL